MSLPLIFRPEVQSEIEDAYLWYERQRAGLGDDFLASVDRALERIQQGPDTYPPVYRDVRLVLTRRFPYGVYFQVASDHVLIVAVQHTHRNPNAWKKRV